MLVCSDAGSDGDEPQPTSPLLKTLSDIEKKKGQALPVPQQSRRTEKHLEHKMVMHFIISTVTYADII